MYAIQAYKIVMKPVSILILSLALLSGSLYVSAQSFKERFKKAAEKIGKELKTVKLNSSLKEDFLTEIYDVYMGCPLLEVKYINNEYVIPDGFIFVN